MLEHVFELLQTLLPMFISMLLGGVHINQQGQLARKVVNHGQLFGLQQQDIWTAQSIGRTAVRQFLFNVSHRVVAKIAGQAATKARHPRAKRHLETLLVAGYEVQRVAMVGFHHHAIGHHLGVRVRAKTIGTQQGTRGQANEAVSAKPLAAHHRFEQKAVLAPVLVKSQLQVERKRGFKVGKRFEHQGNAVKALL